MLCTHSRCRLDPSFATIKKREGFVLDDKHERRAMTSALDLRKNANQVIHVHERVVQSRLVQQSGRINEVHAHAAPTRLGDGQLQAAIVEQVLQLLEVLDVHRRGHGNGHGRRVKVPLLELGHEGIERLTGGAGQRQNVRRHLILLVVAVVASVVLLLLTSGRVCSSRRVCGGLRRVAVRLELHRLAVVAAAPGLVLGLGVVLSV
ncbi:hypothetical protein BC828DRAFT_257803 [Blastocladiella britannica]|nr:hypothetical protein BC828DRAFT_257803 [Blastocladiella britannica]